MGSGRCLVREGVGAETVTPVTLLRSLVTLLRHQVLRRACDHRQFE